MNHRVDHDELIPFTRRLALDIVSNDQPGVRQIRATYDAVASTTVDNGWQIEEHGSAAWRKREFSAGEVERRRDQIMQRGRSQG